MFTEKEITQAIELYTDYHSDMGLTTYVNRETDQDGNIISFYLGLEDEDGNAVTGYDEHY